MSIDIGRYGKIGLTLIGVYVLIFSWFVVLTFMHNDVSMANTIIAAQLALLCTIFAAIVGYLGTRINKPIKGVDE